jgi:hypothetical protein
MAKLDWMPAKGYLERRRYDGQSRLTGHAWPAHNFWPERKFWPETYRCQQSHGGQPIGRWPALASAGQVNAPLPMAPPEGEELLALRGTGLPELIPGKTKAARSRENARRMGKIKR